MRDCHKGHSALVNRPFWYTEHTVIIRNKWHLTYRNVKGMLGWHTQCKSEQREMVQKVLYTVQYVGGLKEMIKFNQDATQWTHDYHMAPNGNQSLTSCPTVPYVLPRCYEGSLPHVHLDQFPVHQQTAWKWLRQSQHCHCSRPTASHDHLKSIKV